MPITQSLARPVRASRRATGQRGAVLLALCAGIQAQDVRLPQAPTMSAHVTGPSVVNMAVAIGKMMKDKHGSERRTCGPPWPGRPAARELPKLGPLYREGWYIVFAILLLVVLLWVMTRANLVPWLATRCC